MRIIHFILTFLLFNCCVKPIPNQNYIKSHSIIFEYKNKEGLIEISDDIKNVVLLDEDYCLEVVLNYNDMEIDYDNIDSKELRTASKKYYSSMNNEIIGSFNLNCDDLIVSEYTPFVFAIYKGINAFQRSNAVAESLKNEPQIKELRITPYHLYDSNFDEPFLKIENSKTRVGTDYIEDNYPVGTPYTGYGIKIGILDDGYFNENDPIFNGYSVENVYDTTPGNDPHPMKVASVIVSSNGIAPSSSIYYVDVNSDYGYCGIERLINKNVDIVNMSIGAASCMNNGSYNPGLEIYLDRIYLSTHIIMVAAADNSLNKSGSGGFVCLPALCANVISVGSVKKAGDLWVPSDFSSYNCKNDVHSNPNIVAVGESRKIPYVEESKNGTSYSTPAVTAAIALYFEKNGVKPLPDVLSVLAATANHVDIDYTPHTIQLVDGNGNYTGETIYCTNTLKANGLYERTGAGELDITRLLGYNNVQLPSNTSYSNTNYRFLSQHYINSGYKVKICLAWDRYADSSSLGTLPEFDLFLKYTYFSDVVSNTSSLSTNMKIIYATISSTEDYKIYLRPYSHYYQRFVNYGFRIYI